MKPWGAGGGPISSTAPHTLGAHVPSGLQHQVVALLGPGPKLVAFLSLCNEALFPTVVLRTGFLYNS